MTSPADHPPMYDFYEEFYRATLTSAAHAELCERAYGRNLAQHGFADMAQLDALIRVACLNSTTRALDIGCGSGHITEYLSDTTGAHFTGIDYSPIAITQAQARTQEKADRLTFLTCDMSALPFPEHSFDAIIAIDTLYFADLDAMLTQFRRLLAPGGQILAYFTHAADPMNPIATFPRETLPPDRTPPAEAFRRREFSYTCWDFSEADYRHEVRMRAALSDLEPLFRAEGNAFLYESRNGETEGTIAAIEAGCHARYLYQAREQER